MADIFDELKKLILVTPRFHLIVSSWHATSDFIKRQKVDTVWFRNFQCTSNVLKGEGCYRRAVSFKSRRQRDSKSTSFSPFSSWKWFNPLPHSHRGPWLWELGRSYFPMPFIYSSLLLIFWRGKNMNLNPIPPNSYVCIYRFIHDHVRLWLQKTEKYKHGYR